MIYSTYFRTMSKTRHDIFYSTIHSFRHKLIKISRYLCIDEPITLLFIYHNYLSIHLSSLLDGCDKTRL